MAHQNCGGGLVGMALPQLTLLVFLLTFVTADGGNETADLSKLNASGATEECIQSLSCNQCPLSSCYFVKLPGKTLCVKQLGEVHVPYWQRKTISKPGTDSDVVSRCYKPELPIITGNDIVDGILCGILLLLGMIILAVITTFTRIWGEWFSQRFMRSKKKEEISLDENDQLPTGAEME